MKSIKSVKATWNESTVAESDSCPIVEGNHYFPKDSVDMSLLTRSETSTFCPWKGHATYYHLDIGGKRNTNCVWTYENPSQQALKLKDHFAFWNGVEIETDGNS